MVDWRDNLIEDAEGIRAVIGETRRIAVLGIKPESRAAQPAHFVPRYMLDHGFEIVPVPVYYPELTEIFGLPIYRRMEEVPGEVDMVNVFRRSRDVPPHVPDILAKRPKSVWLQLGIRHDEAARELAEAGIRVVQDRCLMVEHRRAPLDGPTAR